MHNPTFKFDIQFIVLNKMFAMSIIYYDPACVSIRLKNTKRHSRLLHLATFNCTQWVNNKSCNTRNSCNKFIQRCNIDKRMSAFVAASVFHTTIWMIMLDNFSVNTRRYINLVGVKLLLKLWLMDSVNGP